MPVIARVNGNICGRGHTLEIAGQVLYYVSVDADRPGAQGCGAPGSFVTFQIGARLMQAGAPWAGSGPQGLSLGAER
jgi:hypothetical protein